MRSIGAAHVVDYTREDFTGGRSQYDVILDNVSSLPLTRLRQALTPKGILVLNGGGSPGHVFGPVAGILRAVVANSFVSQRLRPLPSRQNQAELLAVTGLIEGGKLMPVVTGPIPWLTRPRVCAPWSKGTRAARPSSPWREIGRCAGPHHHDPPMFERNVPTAKIHGVGNGGEPVPFQNCRVPPACGFGRTQVRSIVQHQARRSAHGGTLIQAGQVPGYRGQCPVCCQVTAVNGRSWQRRAPG